MFKQIYNAYKTKYNNKYILNKYLNNNNIFK